MVSAYAVPLLSGLLERLHATHASMSGCLEDCRCHFVNPPVLSRHLPSSTKTPQLAGGIGGESCLGVGCGGGDEGDGGVGDGGGGVGDGGVGNGGGDEGDGCMGDGGGGVRDGGVEAEDGEGVGEGGDGAEGCCEGDGKGDSRGGEGGGEGCGDSDAVTKYSCKGLVGLPKFSLLMNILMRAALYGVISYKPQSASSNTYEMGLTLLSPCTVRENSEPSN